MKLSEFYTSISSGRTDEEYFLSKNNFSVISSLFLQTEIEPAFIATSGQFLQFGKNQTSTNYFHIETQNSESENNFAYIHLNESQIEFNTSNYTGNININTNNLKFKNHSLNTPSGLVQLDQNGKIPNILLDQNIKYETSNMFMLSGGVYYDCTQTLLSSIIFTFNSSMNNSMCLFKTDSIITFDFTFPSAGLYINEPINLEGDCTYLISIENNVIMWSELVDAITLSNM